MKGVAIAAPASYIGATALDVSPAAPVRDREAVPARAGSPEQPPLFHAASQKVIPFEQLQRQAAARLAPPESPPAAAPGLKSAAPPRAASRKPAPKAGQGNFDFLPGVPQGERILATGVPAQLYGDGRVAPPLRRMTAGAMDVSMVLLGFGVFAGAARLAGPALGAGTGPAFGAGKTVWIVLSVSLILIALFYGLLWALARRETAGMKWTQLQLVTFDGSPLDGRDRAIRFVSAWLSFCSGGLGLLWALADEESLAFHDHISKTYPAEMGSRTAFVRPQR